MKHLMGPVAGLVLAALAFPAVAQVDLAPYLKKDTYEEIKISPTGEYYAATVPLEDRTILLIIRRADKAFTARVAGVKNSVVADFHWVNDTRVLVSMAERFSSLETPRLTGELHAINADGSGGRTLMAHFDQSANSKTVKYDNFVAGFLADDLPGDDRNVLISVQAFGYDPNTRIERMDVYNGRRSPVASAPVHRAGFTTDHAGEVRFARGAGNDNVNKLYYRQARGSEWQLINDEAQSGRVEAALGFSADNTVAYLQVEQASGPDAIVAMNIASGERTQLLRDDVVDPYAIIYDAGNVPVGASFMKDRLVNRFFDEKAPYARLHRQLEKAIPDSSIRFLSDTRDGLHLVVASSDRNPGDFFLFDSKTNTAERIFGRAEWFDPARTATVRPVELKARDGLTLHGYLTLPRGSDGKKLPTVVHPHGGPFGVFDEWGFDRETQMLADAGYAVLQVNFRGSGNYGRDFLHAGALQWGGTMQDDVTDATRWAVDQGIVDPARICIFGGSYGGYAALMGAAREPDLYRCAVGYVGVYDLPDVVDENSDNARWMRNWSVDWIGDPKALGAVSPSRMADRIRMPVFLAAGGKDDIAPLHHSQKMEKALKAAGTPVETLYFPTEGHGFYTDAHRREFYERLLDFLSRNIGGEKADAKAGASATAR